MTINSRVIKTFLAWAPDAVDVPLNNGLRVQVLPTMYDLPRARKHQYAAFIAQDALLVVWDDEATNLVPRAKSIEAELMQLVWKTNDDDEENGDMKKGPAVVAEEIDEESGEVLPEKVGIGILSMSVHALTDAAEADTSSEHSTRGMHPDYYHMHVGCRLQGGSDRDCD